MINKTPLELWIAKKIGVADGRLCREQITRYQLRKIGETVRFAYLRSPFYHKWLEGVAEKEIVCLNDIQRLPFTSSEDIIKSALQFLCVSQTDITRVVTLPSSGTTGNAKRIYFTGADQELTVDFFTTGMSSIVGPDDRVLILLPGERPGSIGDLLIKALERLGATPILCSRGLSISEMLNTLVREQITSVVGVPAQALALARYSLQEKAIVAVRSVLLSTDYIPVAIVRELERIWDCKVFKHYGMTEMGLGGGINCAAYAGYHLREADLYFEIIDPQTCAPVADGCEGEIVFTTLTRQGMPLIRYRTGDISRFLTEPCPCGTVLKRLDIIKKRRHGEVFINNEEYFTMSELDEVLFAVAGVIDFTAAVDNVKNATCLIIEVLTMQHFFTNTEYLAYQALEKLPALNRARVAGRLRIYIRTVSCDNTLLPKMTKRVITEMKG